MDQVQSPEGIVAVAGTVTGMIAGGMAGKKINAKLSAGKGEGIF